MESIDTRKVNGDLVVCVTGEITIDDVAGLKDRLGALLAESGDAARLVLDLSGVGFIDSTGIGFLVSSKARVREAGMEFVLASPSEPVARTLALVQLTEFFGLEPPGG
jgi:anti-sigma B factor antagonist